jgi:DNA invertase Pin-like site-specific DNA recombinase
MATPRAPESPAAAALPDISPERTRYLLPKDLAEALRRLGDKEIDTLFEAVASEAERRGRLLRTPPSRTPPVEDAGGLLTKGKLNAVRAAFKAGVKPAAIARQFGISQGDVKRALAAEGRNQKSRR